MMRTIVILIAGLCWSSAALLADPIPKPGPVPKIKGMTWDGETSKGEKISYRFLDDGKLEWTKTMPNGILATYQNGTWKQDGKKVTWETNSHYADYTGTVTKNEMKVEAKNVKDVTWTITLKPVKDETKDEKKPE